MLCQGFFYIFFEKTSIIDRNLNELLRYAGRETQTLRLYGLENPDPMIMRAGRPRPYDIV